MDLEIPQKVLDASKELARIGEHITGNPEIRGFHLSYLVGSHSDGFRLVDTPIGEVRSPYGGPQGIKAYSVEKTMRLATGHLRDPALVTSWQTRDNNLKRYGGAVLFPGLNRTKPFTVFGPSAFSDDLDEAIALVLGKEADVLSHEHFIDRVVRITSNPVYERVTRDFYGS